MIEAERLSKWYGQVIGLNDVTLTLESGVTALLGPNGAGKTTFLRLMTGQLRPSSGGIRLFGEPVWNNPRVLRRIGFCPEEDAFFEFMTGLEFVTCMARLSGIGGAEATERATRAMEEVGLTDAMHRSVGGYSKGMRQRTKFAQAIVHDPDILFLDEPMTGADPVARRALRELIAKHADAGKQIVVSSHVLHEVEALTDRFALIHKGRVRASGTVSEIRELMDSFPHRIVVRCDAPRKLAERLVAAPHVVGLELGEGELTAQTNDPGAFFDTLPEWVEQADLAVSEFYSEDDTMQAVFRYLVSR